MNDQNLVSTISSDVDALDGKVRGIAAASQRRYRLNAEPGTTLHQFGEYEAADAEGRDAIDEACRDAYQEIMEDVDRYLSVEMRTMSEPANADDVATVTFALSREGITADELQALLDRYKGNHQLASGIVERAHAAGYRLDNEPEALRVFRDDAYRAAGRVLTRYNRNAFVNSPDSFASDVVLNLRHIDFMGRAY